MAATYAGDAPKASQFNIDTARYYSNDSTSTYNGNTETVIKWSTPWTTSPYVTASGVNNTTFTLNKDGIWLIEFSWRVSSQSGNNTIGDLFAWAYLANAGNTYAVCGESIAAPIRGTPKPSALTIRAFNAGDQIEFRIKNLVDATLVSQCFGEAEHCSFTWLQGF